MSDIDVMKPVVKLPSKSRPTVTAVDHLSGQEMVVSNHSPRPNGTYSSSPSSFSDSLVTHQLYLIDLPATLTEHQIRQALASCEPIEVHLAKADADLVTGWVTFATREQADRAYTLFNGVRLSNGDHLHLCIYPPSNGPEPEAQSSIFQITGLRSDTTQFSLYDLFRPHGPMSLCKLISDESGFKGMALVQYFRIQDGDEAVASMHERDILGHSISMVPLVARSRQRSAEVWPRPATADSPISMHRHPTFSPSPSSHATAPVSTILRPMSATHDRVHDRVHDHAHYRLSSSPTSPTSLPSSPTPAVDFTNLYIKNLDPNVKNSDLFNHFRKFGHIISARVMKNMQTKQSKGFGFVSFSKSEEAYCALQEMNGKCLLSKPILVAFHEPKKARDGKAPLHDATFSLPFVDRSRPKPPFSMPHSLLSSSPFLPTMPTTSSLPLIHAAPPPPLPPSRIYPATTTASTLASASASATFPVLSDPLTGYRATTFHPTMVSDQHHHHHHHHPTHPPYSMLMEKPAFAHHRPKDRLTRWHSVTHDVSMRRPPVSAALVPPPRPTLRRRGSIESLSSAMTEATSSMQRQRMRHAIIQCGGLTDDVDDIVSMLLTLHRKERSLCLFNADILRQKIHQARSALAWFHQSLDKATVAATVSATSTIMAVAKPPVAASTPPAPSVDLLWNVSLPPRGSRAIPIVAPPPDKTQETDAATKTQAIDEVGAFLASIQHLSSYEQKQKLGDRLFPFVKALGVKPASKITIRLLDTVALRDLARVMHDPVKLRARVDVVMATLSTSLHPSVVSGSTLTTLHH